MLPNVIVRDVSRADVDRIADWLTDEEVASRWFGHYAFGDPVHRGYEPGHMLEASDSEWGRVFRTGPHRVILSICDERGEHIGEVQLLSDGSGGAELSLLVGRKDLWHRGYGSATVIKLLGMAFDEYRFNRVWVHVPPDNEPALGLFRKLGFVQESTRDLCGRRDGSMLKAQLLAISSGGFALEQSRRRREGEAPLITVTGPPRSGSELVAKRAARRLNVRYLDEEIETRTCRRLRCSSGELRSLRGSYRSAWRKMLGDLVASFGRYPNVEDAFYGSGSFAMDAGDFGQYDDYLTRARYLDALRGVIAEAAREGDAVIHGHFGYRFTAGFHVLVTADGPPGGREWREWASIAKRMFQTDPLDVSQYDLVINTDRQSVESAVQTLVAAVSPSIERVRVPVL